MVIKCKECSTPMDIAAIKGLYWREVCEDCIKCNNPKYKKPYIAKSGIEQRFCSDECAEKINGK